MNSSQSTLQPFDARPLFKQVRSSLLQLLGDLSPPDWDRPTAAGHWLVSDIAAHLLGDDVSRLSRSRDDYPGPGPSVGETLAQFLNKFNEQWVEACARISNQVIQDLLAVTSDLMMSYWQQVDLDSLGEPVSWVYPGQPAPVWLDCARDFTEDWIHQEQIRQAVGREQRPDVTVLYAVLDTFMHAMIHTLYQHDLPHGSTLVVRLEPELHTSWRWSHGGGGWSASAGVEQPTTEIISGWAHTDCRGASGGNPQRAWHSVTKVVDSDS